MNDISIGTLVSLLALMLIFSAFFSGSETALMALNRYRLRHLVKLKKKSAIKTQNLLNRPDRLFGLIMFCNTFVNNFAAAIATVIALKMYGTKEFSIPVAITALTLIMLIFSEITPKTLATHRPERLALPASWLLRPLQNLLYPIVCTINLIVRLLLKLFRVDIKATPHGSLSKDELKIIIAEAESVMPSRYQNMLLGILDLESATVEDIMTPRHQIVGIDLELPIEDIIKTIQNSPHTRLAVYKKSVDRTIGFVHLRKLLTKITQEGFDKQSIINCSDKPAFIPDSTPVHIQMQRFKQDRIRIGLVVDEYGDVQGLVTLDDLLQEIVGELITEDITVKKQHDGSYLVDANITVRELNRITHWSLPTEGPKTLNGLIIEFMETIPETGTSIKLHDYPLEIISCDKNSVKSVKFLPLKK